MKKNGNRSLWAKWSRFKTRQTQNVVSLQLALWTSFWRVGEQRATDTMKSTQRSKVEQDLELNFASQVSGWLFCLSYLGRFFSELCILRTHTIVIVAQDLVWVLAVRNNFLKVLVLVAYLPSWSSSWHARPWTWREGWSCAKTCSFANIKCSRSCLYRNGHNSARLLWTFMADCSFWDIYAQ